MIGYSRLRKREFYMFGGFSDSRNVRVQRGKCWAYYRRYAP